MEETQQAKQERNARVQARYDELTAIGKHGHYETMFQVVREEVARVTVYAAALHSTASAILLVDGDRDHMNKSYMTCGMTQAIAGFLKSTARDLGYREEAR